MTKRHLDDNELENVSGGVESGEFSPLDPEGSGGGITGVERPEDPEVKQQGDPTENRGDVHEF